MKVKIIKLREDARVPLYATESSAGADLYSPDRYVIKPGETAFVKTGLALEIPDGYAGLIYARSGMASKKGLAPANKVGVIDSDYRGEITVALFNHSAETREIGEGERIAQIIITPYLKADFEVSYALSDTERGKGGFGSTGTK